ncbi:hypothetical protein [Agarivorans litoreus]|uniref:hypothetical protein n=1 Tax=Agarivorans litoreus TaxID=1510455 RepID=UPI001C7D7590|nr:hypothetical protein [Agarivorans litoreus]
MGKWLFCLGLFSYSAIANQLAIEVIEGAYPKLTFRVEAAKQLELMPITKASVNEQADALQISLPASNACVYDNLQLLRGRLIILELAWNSSIQQQVNVLSQAKLWKDLPYRVLVPSSSKSCKVKDLELHFPSLSAFSGGWGRLKLNDTTGVIAHGFFVVQQVGNVYTFNKVVPNNVKAQRYWLKYYAQ